MKTALFGGSFDPIHSEHIALIAAAKEQLGLDSVLLVPSCVAPHKGGGARENGASRLEACRIALRSFPWAQAVDWELNAGGISYTYLTCRLFQQRMDGERYFLVGADMLENFFSWREPDDILSRVTLVACGRGEHIPAGMHERFRSRFGKDFLELDFVGKPVSSTALRTALAFRRKTQVSLEGLDVAVLSYFDREGLYLYPHAEEALSLEKADRIAHSYRVAKLACARARSVQVPEEKALLASMLHDCGKYISLDDPLLAGFSPPEEVPPPVLHQYIGAYLAERRFGITDAEILDAIRFHTSGRADMGRLEQLIWLSDLLEEGRDFPGVEELRKLFWEDLEECMTAALEHQLAYLQGGQIYPLTRQAYEYFRASRK